MVRGMIIIRSSSRYTQERLVSMGNILDPAQVLAIKDPEWKRLSRRQSVFFDEATRAVRFSERIRFLSRERRARCEARGARRIRKRLHGNINGHIAEFNSTL